jgi:hypothetical protein
MTPRPARCSPLARIRKICLSLPETSERLSHGAPAFIIRGKRAFVTYMDNHHNDGRLAIWCAASPEIQSMLVRGAPKHYFVPPYVGHLGWVGCASIGVLGGTGSPERSRTRIWPSCPRS